MLTRTDLRGGLPPTAALRALLPRADMDVDAVLDRVRPIVAAVAERGTEAVLEFGGLPHPTILAAAAMLDVDEVWAVGGAQAIALLAYGGTDTDGAELEPVDVVTGPGNIYTTAAKRLLRGLIGIDAEAGPTEIA